jgi:uncharacterized repeat protein (TIGR03803 family)
MIDLNHPRNPVIGPRAGFFLGVFVLFVLLAALGWGLAGQAAAQTFTTIHSFTGGDGATPMQRLILSNQTLYGKTEMGGITDNGTVFAVGIDGSGFRDLHTFNLSDGGWPRGGLILSSNTLYGTTSVGGNWAWGTVFKLSTDGTSFTNLYNFDGTNGAVPVGPLAFSGDTIYGTTWAEDTDGLGWGKVYAISREGINFTNLYSFTDFERGSAIGVILSSNTLYGTRTGDIGGSTGGSIFRLNVDGSGFSTVYQFGGYNDLLDTVILSGDTLYGVVSGTVFKVNTDGTSFASLYATSASGVMLSGDVLYGTSTYGGPLGNGFVFKLKTDGTGFTTLHSFTALQTNSFGAIYNSDGANPYSGLILSDNTLYGTCESGGNGGHGTIFSISLSPQLTISPAGASLVLSWPTNFTGFTLQSTTNLVSPVWTNNLPAPVVVNAQFAVTHVISGTQQFFRLSQ